MATLATSATSHINKAKAGEQPQDSSSRDKGAQLNLNDLRFKVANELQSSLELEATLRTFFDRICSVVHCSGLKYDYAEKNLNLHFGDDATHTANYKVSSTEEQLGDLQFLRKHPFAEAELAVIEMLIGVLFYPLRNALKYRAAIERALVDGLTGLNNRHALELASIREVKLAQRHSKPLSILVIDIDHFKQINDQHGHYVGDCTLSDTAKVIADTLRESDQIFRFGGEEFVALLTETHIDDAEMTAERIRKAIERTAIQSDELKLSVTASVGVASLNKSEDFNDVFKRADSALYNAKQSGRNRVKASYAGEEIKKIA